jgi:hypothetical protein
MLQQPETGQQQAEAGEGKQPATDLLHKCTEPVTNKGKQYFRAVSSCGPAVDSSALKIYVSGT